MAYWGGTLGSDEGLGLGGEEEVVVAGREDGRPTLGMTKKRKASMAKSTMVTKAKNCVVVWCGVVGCGVV